MKFLYSNKQSGMTLLEVILSLTLVVFLVMTSGDLLRQSMDVKREFSSQDLVNHRILKLMNLITNDLEHAYIIPSTNLVRLVSSRTSQTIFKIEEVLSLLNVSFTSTSNTPLKKNMHQADTVYIVYSLEKSKTQGRYILYRASGNIPESFKDIPPKVAVMNDIKKLEILPWNGEDWYKDKWDSTSGDYKDSLPKLIKINLEMFEVPYDEYNDKATNEASLSLSTVIRLPNADLLEEKRTGTSTIDWEKM